MFAVLEGGGGKEWKTDGMDRSIVRNNENSELGSIAQGDKICQREAAPDKAPLSAQGQVVES